MLRAMGTRTDNGRTVVFFGLTHEDLEGLLARRPIEFAGETLGEAERDYVIFVEASHERLTCELAKVGGGKLPPNAWVRGN